MDRTSISPWPLLLSPCPVYENPPVRIETGPSSHCYWSLAYPSHPDTSPRILYHPTQHQSTAYSCTWTPKLKINLPCSFFLPFSSYLQCRMWGFLCNSAKRPVAVCLLFRFSWSCQLSTSEVSVFQTRDPDVFVHFLLCITPSTYQSLSVLLGPVWFLLPRQQCIELPLSLKRNRLNRLIRS